MTRHGGRPTPLLVALVFLFVSDRVQAQTPPDGQLWFEFTLSWPKTPRLTYQIDLEPQFLVIIPPGESAWATLQVTPSVEYAVKRWLDVVGQFLYAPTKQTNHENSREVTSRAGVRFHLLSRDLPTHDRDRLRELPPSRRLVLRDFARIEQRNIFYSDGKSTSHTWRFRNRLEFQLPLNHENMTVDNTRYFMTDWEWFVPIGGDARERFANKQRIRVGFGYRQNFKWRYEALYIWGRSLDTTTNSFTTADNIIYFGVKRMF